jgi:hypothetical protein
VHDLDYLYELCLKMGGDPERCSFGVLVERLIEEVGLVKCVERGAAAKCFEKCLERCGSGEDCVKACHTAVDAARSITKDVLRGPCRW